MAQLCVVPVEIVVCGDYFGGERSKCRQRVERVVLLDLH